MCGIAGVLTLNSSVTPEDIVQVHRMTDILRHRGPDSRHVLHDDRCALGNTRLKIIDLSSNADLPMTNDDRSVWLTYNGEITNYKELIHKFSLDKKYRFRSTSDAEVLLRLYEEIGISLLDHVSGMFAFCLYDVRKAKAYVVRDFFGLRPLFFMAKENRFYFASEIKSFLQLPAFRGELNHEAIYHFFSLAYIPGSLTPFKDVTEVRSGQLYEVDLKAGTFQEREYYRVRYLPNDSLDERDTALRLHGVLLDAVRRNLISDAPLGLTLSGGFDTSSLLALTKELYPEREVHTFSIKINEPSFDESRYQKIVVDYFKPVHHEIVVNPQDVADNLLRHMAYLDEPTGDGAAIPSFLLSREAKKTVSVLLSGEGGDEVFNAYETHGAYKMRRLYRRYAPPFLRRLLREGARRLPTSYNKLSLDFILKRFTEGAEKSVPESHLFWRHVLTDDEKRRLLRRPPDDFRETVHYFSDMFDELDFADELNRISAIDMKYYFVDDLMVKNDRTFMAHSVEARFPYMDRSVVEFVSRIPPEMRLKGLRRRHIQKEAMKPYLPKEIYRRTNMGLEMPHSIWFMKSLKDFYGKYFTRENVGRSGLLDPAMVEGLWQDHFSRKRDNGRALWCVLNFMIWFDMFVWKKDYKNYLA
ncbi:MAG TPA: asparagine synthase (glutamine-hydrolyzing) [Elusimicrobiota bacterium]|nr:asparagine synthase (glutamine-hydrolyzing) [Elusimicrobiota bacterium]